MKQAILERHPALELHLSTTIGYRLMFTESVILLQVLERLMAKGIVGLGLHDGLMVPGSKAEATATIMEEVAQEVTGAHIPVELKPMPKGSEVISALDI
jgi:hypothetical protein